MKYVSGVYMEPGLKVARVMTKKEVKRRNSRKGKEAQHWRKVKVGEKYRL